MNQEPDIHITIDNSGHPVEPSSHAAPTESTPDEKRKFRRLVIGLAIFSILLTLVRGWSVRQLLDDVIATFFIVFAGFKLLNIETFIDDFRRYDKLAQRFRPWAYIFPFIEAILGFAYMFTYKSAVLNTMTLVIMGVAGYGVWQTMQSSKRRGHHFAATHVGKRIKVPISTVSLVEDWLTFLLAAVLLFIK